MPPLITALFAAPVTAPVHAPVNAPIAMHDAPPVKTTETASTVITARPAIHNKKTPVVYY